MTDIQDLARALIEDPAYEAALANRLKAGTASNAIVRMLQQYARRPVEGDAGRTSTHRGGTLVGYVGGRHRRYRAQRRGQEAGALREMAHVGSAGADLV